MTIPIFLTIDDSYAPYASCAIGSIIENCDKKQNYKIHIVYQDLSDTNMNKLKELENNNVKIEFKEMKEGLEEITDRVENRLRCDYFSISIYLRLFIPDIFPEYDKGIYIDSDVIVPGDISKMYELDLKDNLIGACTDESIQEVPELIKYIEQGIGVKKNEYVNSGVLLMNLKELRKKKFSVKFLELLTKYHFDTVAPDQDYLNGMCNGKILYMDSSWDVMPNKDKEPVKNPNLIHYNLFDKPWCYDNIQYEEYFWKYAEKSNFYEEIKQYKKNYSEEQMKSDRRCFEELLRKGNSIPDTENTFKKRYESGDKIRVW